MREILKTYPPSREYILEMLHALQDQEPRHYLSKEALQEVASYLNLPLSEVKGVASFYSMFSFTPRGRHVIRVCESPPCQLLGAMSVLEELKKVLAVKQGETTADGLFTLETASCLGVCGVAPAMMIDDEVYGNLTSEQIRRILEQIRREDAPS